MLRRIFPLLVFLLTSVSVCGQRTNSAYWDYIERYKGMAIEQMQRYRIPASITLAQGLLESAAGRSTLATKANNHFGIKCHKDWKGPYVLRDDDAPNERFRKYESAAQSFEDHSQFLLRQRYASLFTLSITDYKGWAHGLKRCGYATSPTYAQQLITIIENYQLYQYDNGRLIVDTPRQPVSGGQSPLAGRTPVADQSSFFATHPIGKNNGSYYIIARQGDTMEDIARGCEVRKRKLRKYNELPRRYKPQAGDIIYLDSKSKRAAKQYKGHYHTLSRGESLYSISQRYGMKLKSLYKLNGLTPDYTPQVGDKIRIR